MLLQLESEFLKISLKTGQILIRDKPEKDGKDPNSENKCC